jgi:hypothetical protein
VRPAQELVQAAIDASVSVDSSHVDEDTWEPALAVQMARVELLEELIAQWETMGVTCNDLREMLREAKTR